MKQDTLKRLKNGMRRIRERIDRERNHVRKANLIKTYLQMFKLLEDT